MKEKPREPNVKTQLTQRDIEHNLARNPTFGSLRGGCQFASVIMIMQPRVTNLIGSVILLGGNAASTFIHNAVASGLHDWVNVLLCQGGNSVPQQHAWILMGRLSSLKRCHNSRNNIQPVNSIFYLYLVN